MIYRNFKFRIGYDYSYDGFAPYLIGEDAAGKRVSFRLVAALAPDYAPTPALLDTPLETVDMRSLLQAIVDEAAKMQIVPGDSASTLAAMKAHLEDMRTLALKDVSK